MLFFGILSILLAVASADENCYTQVNNICKPNATVNELGLKCGAQYRSIATHQIKLQTYANDNLRSSFQYLLLSSHFGNYDANRDGLKTLYRKLSDQNWEDTISVLKYLGKRGGTANFNECHHCVNEILDLDEIQSLGKALDIQKSLVNEASNIHTLVMHNTDKSRSDPDIMHYMQEQFIEPQTKRIRELAGHIHDLKSIISTTEDASIGVFLFDEYLKKSL